MAKPEPDCGLTDAEKAFALRMAFHVTQGASLGSAAQAVLDDDARLFTAALDRGTSQYFPTPCEMGRATHAGHRKGNLIASILAEQVHSAFRAQAAA